MEQLSNLGEQLVVNRNHFSQEQQHHQLFKNKVKNSQHNKIYNLSEFKPSTWELLNMFNSTSHKICLIVGFILNVILGCLSVGFIILCGFLINYSYREKGKDDKDDIISSFMTRNNTNNNIHHLPNNNEISIPGLKAFYINIDIEKLNLTNEYFIIYVFIILFIFTLQKFLLSYVDNSKALLYQTKCFKYLMSKEIPFYTEDRKLTILGIESSTAHNYNNSLQLSNSRIFANSLEQTLSKTLDDSKLINSNLSMGNSILNTNTSDTLYLNNIESSGKDSYEIINNYSLINTLDNTKLASNIKDLSFKVQVASKLGKMVYSIASTLSICGVSFLFSWKIALIVLVGTFIVGLFMNLHLVVLEKEKKNNESIQTKSIEIAKECLYNNRELTIQGNIEYHKKRFNNSLLEYDSIEEFNTKKIYINDDLKNNECNISNQTLNDTYSGNMVITKNNDIVNTNKRNQRGSYYLTAILISLIKFLQLLTLLLIIFYGNYIHNQIEIKYDDKSFIDNEDLEVADISCLIISILICFYNLTVFFANKKYLNEINSKESAEFFHVVYDLSKDFIVKKTGVTAGLMLKPNRDLVKPSIKFENVDLIDNNITSSNYNSYIENQNTVLCSNLSFEIKPFEKVFITGSNISYTLPNVLLKTINSDKGEIYIDIYKVKDIAIEYLRGLVSSFSPNDVLFENMSIRENLLLGRESTVEKLIELKNLDSRKIMIDIHTNTDRHLSDNLDNSNKTENIKFSSIEDFIIYTCKITHAWDFISDLPNGINYVITRDDLLLKNKYLSYFHLTLLKLTRAILTEPKILILNNPNQLIYNLMELDICEDDAISNTSNTSNKHRNTNYDKRMNKEEFETTIAVYDEILNKVSENVTTLVIGDDLKYIKEKYAKNTDGLCCDKIISLSKGKLLFNGTIEELEDNVVMKKAIYDKLQDASDKRHLLEKTLYQDNIYKTVLNKQESAIIKSEIANNKNNNISNNNNNGQTNDDLMDIKIKGLKLENSKFNTFYNIIYNVMHSILYYTSSFSSQLHDDSLKLNITDSFSLEKTKKLVHNDSSFNMNNVFTDCPSTLIEELYYPSLKFFFTSIIIHSRSNLLYYFNIFLSILLVAIYITFGLLVSYVLKSEIQKELDKEISDNFEKIEDYYFILLFVFLSIVVNYLQRVINGKLIARLKSYTQKVIFKQIIEGDQVNNSIINNNIKKSNLLNFMLSVNNNNEHTSFFLSEFNETLYKEKFNAILNSSSSFQNTKFKNYKEINKLMMILFKYTNQIEILINYKLGFFQYSVFIIFYLIYIIILRHLIGIISIGFFVLIIIINKAIYKINQIYSKEVYNTQKEAFIYSRKCLNNYTFLNFYNDNFHSNSFYSTTLDKIKDRTLAGYSFITAFFSGINLCIFLIWISLSFYINANYFRGSNVNEHEIITPFFCFIFCLIGLKLNELNRNYIFGDGIDNCYKISIINLYLPLYLKEKYNKNLIVDYKKRNKEDLNSEHSINNNDVNENNEETDALCNLTDDFIKKINSTFLYTSLLVEFFLKSKLKVRNKQNLFNKYSQLLILYKDKNNQNTTINTINAFSRSNGIKENETLIESVSMVVNRIRTNTISSVKNNYLYSTILLNKLNLNILNGKIYNTEILGISGDFSAYQTLKVLEDSYLLELKKQLRDTEKRNKNSHVRNSNVPKTNSLSIFSNSCLVYSDISFRENIFSGITSSRYNTLIYESSEKLNKLYNDSIEICGLSDLIEVNHINEEFFSIKDNFKINYCRAIFKDSEVIIIDDIIQNLDSHCLEIVCKYLDSELFSSKKRMVVIASNRECLLSKCSSIFVIQESKLKYRYSSLEEMKNKQVMINCFFDN